MIDELAKKIASMQIRFSYALIGIFLLITALLAPGILLLVDNVEPSLEKVLPSTIGEVETMNQMRSTFGADMMYIVFEIDTQVYDVRDVSVVQYLDLVKQKLLTLDYILDVQAASDLAKQDGVLSKNPYYIRSVLADDTHFTSEDYSLTVMHVLTDTGASSSTIAKVISDVEDDLASLEQYNPGLSFTITGYNAIDRATFLVIMSDFVSITGVSMLLIGIVVLLTFRSFIRGFLPMIVVMNALVWTMGITGYLGLTITVVSMVSAAMIMGLGIDFGIHIVHSFYEKRQTYSPKKALQQTVQELFRAMLGASLTTMAGFLALLFGVLPAMKTLAIILAIGIFTTLIGATLLLPTIVYLIEERK